MDPNQINSQIRIWVPLILSMLAANHVVTTEWAGQFGPLIVDAVIGILALGFSIWAWRASSKAAHIDSVSSMRDVKVLVGPQAPEAAQAAAEDPTRKSVVPVGAGSVVAAERVSSADGKP